MCIMFYFLPKFANRHVPKQSHLIRMSSAKNTTSQSSMAIVKTKLGFKGEMIRAT